jgi:ubiquinone/menaquinone biosynthesis C-methylase UbiE
MLKSVIDDYSKSNAWKLKSRSNFYEYCHEKDQILEKIYRLAPSKILDIGCGRGRICLPLAQNTNSLVVALDAVEQMVQEVNDMVNSLELKNLYWVLADAEFLPFRQEKFDLAICCQIIGHLTDADGFLKQVASTLSDNGIILISIGNSLSLCEFLDRLIWRYKKGIKHIYSPDVSLQVRGFWRMSYWKLKQLLENSRFKIIGLGGAGLLAHPLIPSFIGRVVEPLSKHFPFRFFSHLVIVAAIKKQNS